MTRPQAGKTRFLCVCLNPVIQRTLVFSRLRMGEVNRTASYRIDAAGKGICVLRVLTQLGEQATHLTQLGGPTRAWFLELCARDGLSLHWVESGAPIRFCTTLIEETLPLATELVEESHPVAENTSELVKARFTSLLGSTNALLFSGTVAAGIQPGTMADLAAMGKKAGKNLYLDLKGSDLLSCLQYHPICVKPNLEELATTVGVSYESVQPNPQAFVEEQGKHFYDNHGTFLVVTRGAAPTLFWDGSYLGEQPVDPIQAVNPIGSGDAFTGGLARMLEQGAGLEAAVREGTRLGGLNAVQLQPGSLGTMTHSRSE